MTQHSGETGKSRAENPQGVEFSVVAPAHNEEGNVGPLADQVESALAPLGRPFELVIVDDGSTDATRARILEQGIRRPWVRCVAMTRTPQGKGVGQSAAMWAGIAAARGRLIATIDADVQQDPSDLRQMYALMNSTGADMIQGDRSHARRDNAIRRVGSIVGRLFRRWLLGDVIRDTGCSLRLMKREVAVQLPLQLRGMHRFIPITAKHLGYRVEEMRVNHRARVSGETKYGLGIWQRAIPGLIDLLAVRYMRSRRRPIDHAEIHPHPGASEARAGSSHDRAGVDSESVQVVLRAETDRQVGAGSAAS